MFEPVVPDLQTAECIINEFLKEKGNYLTIADGKGNVLIPAGELKLTGFHVNSEQ